MRSAFFWCYPWDLLDEGVDVVLDRLVGEVGADALSVATTYHSVSQFRPHTDVAPRRWSHPAAAHFQPQMARYANTRIKPIPASWMKSRNPLELIAGRCERRNVALRAWTVGCHGSALAERYPDAACKGVFEERSTTWLCPACPDVREYVASLVADLSANYRLAAVELESADFGWPHTHGHEKSGLSIGPIEALLLSLCFCESCGQAAADAGVDSLMVQRSVQVHLEPTLSGMPARDQSLEDFVRRDSMLAAYLSVRKSAVTALLDTVRRRTELPIVLHVPFDATISGVDLTEAARRVDAMVLPAWSSDLGVDIAPRLAELRDILDGPQRIERGFHCTRPAFAEGANLVRVVHAAVAAGHDTIGFYNYGIAPGECLQWARQAIRYARREAAGHPTQA